MAHNIFAYCSNTPIMLFDPSGSAAQAPWQMLGFTYDGSAGDFRRLENGLPPLAYENYLNRGGTVKPNYARTVEGTTVSLDAATYIPNHMIYEYYMNETTGVPTSILFGATSWGIDILLEITGKSIPVLNVCMYIVEGILIIEDLADWRDREVMENAISQGTGVLILVISVKGARSGNSTQTVIRTWDGKGDIYV